MVALFSVKNWIKTKKPVSRMNEKLASLFIYFYNFCVSKGYSYSILLSLELSLFLLP